MTWKYETKSLEDIYSMMMNEEEHVHPDCDVLKDIAKKAYEVALYFEKHGMNEDMIMKYLNNDLQCDLLCQFGLESSILHPADISEDDRIFSRSHRQWLTDLSRTKLHWNWEQPEVDLQVTQSTKLESIVQSFKELQELALSYEVKFAKDIAEKAYEVALYFEEHGMNEDMIMKYLNNDLQCDVLCQFGHVSSILHPTDISEEDRIFSRLHRQWLTELSRVKLHWNWKQPEVDLQVTQSIKLESIVQSFKELQEQALSYEVKFAN